MNNFTNKLKSKYTNYLAKDSLTRDLADKVNNLENMPFKFRK